MNYSYAELMKLSQDPNNLLNTEKKTSNHLSPKPRNPTSTIQHPSSRLANQSTALQHQHPPSIRRALRINICPRVESPPRRIHSPSGRVPTRPRADLHRRARAYSAHEQEARPLELLSDLGRCWFSLLSRKVCDRVLRVVPANIHITRDGYSWRAILAT